MSGVEAFARGALEAGVSVVSSYPGEPVSIPVEVLAKNSRRYGIHVEWSVNEKVAYEVALGSSYAGLRAIVFVKHVGMNWIIDPLAGSAFTGTKGGLVVVVGDDPDGSGSTSEEDTRFLSEVTELPLLEPSTPDEARLMVREAFSISERLRLPVIVRTVARLCEETGPVREGPIRRKNTPAFKGKWFSKEGLLHQHAALHEKNLKLEVISEGSAFNRVKDQRGALLGIIGCGSAYELAAQLARSNPGKLALLKVGFVRPPPRERIEAFAKSYRRILVVEEVQPYLESRVRQLLGGTDCRIHGKVTGELPWARSLTLGILAHAVERMVNERMAIPKASASSDHVKTSLFELQPCSQEFDAACPHLATFTALRSAIKKSGVPVTVTGDVGCMSLDIKMGDPVIDTMTCMGASPAVAAGVKIALPDRRVVAVIGDSSFYHSGIQGVLNNVRVGNRVITLILDNMITAQSGFQPDAGTLQAGAGRRRGGTVMDELLKAIGARVEVVDSFTPKLEEALARALVEDEPVVIVSRGMCPIAERADAYRAAVHAATSRP